jgi:beta-glucosidase
MKTEIRIPESRKKDDAPMLKQIFGPSERAAAPSCAKSLVRPSGFGFFSSFVIRHSSLVLAVSCLVWCGAAYAGPELWQDPSQPLDARVHDLVGRLTLEEKASQLLANPPAIPRLGIPAYSHRNECLHGVGDAGIATVFPQAIGMAATWDTPLIHEEADVIATEGRAKHNDYVARHDGNSGEHVGLNFYSPNINIFRDPRWGRGQETYGEDPFLTAQMGVAFIRGLQGDDPKYIKALACAKHYAVHSGPESQRHVFDAKPSERDLYETYLPAFEASVREGHVGSAMGAYSSLYGLPCCADPFLLTDLLRKQWGFDGVVFSDGGAIGDIWAEHHFVATPEEAAAAAVKAGCDVSSGGMGQPAPVLGATNRSGHANSGIKGGWAFSALPAAVEKGLISEAEVDIALTHELTARFRLGLFDPPSQVPWSNIGIDQNDTPEHRALALKVAEESIVLLKNDGLLPLQRAKLKRIAVIGPNADATNMLSGNYNGTPSHAVTILQGIREAAGGDVAVTYVRGCPLDLKKDRSNKPAPEMTAQAVATAKAADVVVFVSGIDATLEKEEGSVKQDVFDGFSRGDRTRIELPAVQEALLKAVQATGKPVVLVNCSGSPMAMPWEARHLSAIVQAWYPGEQGGHAVAEVLFGDVNPAGRLPVTFYASTADLPPFEDYSMSNRTYRYFGGKPLFAFGHGLSYTQFHYVHAALAAKDCGPGDTVKLSFTVKNTGPRDGDEVAQIYFRHVHSAVPQPKLALCGFARVHLAEGQRAQVTLEIPAERFRYWDTAKKQYVVEPGKYELLIGGASDDLRLRAAFNISATVGAREQRTAHL